MCRKAVDVEDLLQTLAFELVGYYGDVYRFLFLLAGVVLNTLFDQWNQDFSERLQGVVASCDEPRYYTEESGQPSWVAWSIIQRLSYGAMKLGVQ